MVTFFVRRFFRKLGKQIDIIPAAAIRELQNYAWPGNVREREQMIERAVIKTRGPVFDLIDKLESPFKDSEKNRGEY